MIQPALRVENIYDVLNPQGAGVNGYLKLKCLQVQDRVVSLANPGDMVAVSDECSPAYIKYMLHVVRVTDALVLRYKVSHDLREYISARSVFEGLAQDPQWEEVRRRSPTISPYMQSAAIYEAARKADIAVPQETWKTVVTDRLIERMNDKAILYQECKELGIPVPRHWIIDGKQLVDYVTGLLKEGHSPLYIRQTRSGGAFGNATVEQAGSRYLIHELGDHILSHNEFTQALESFIKTLFGEEFLITELLDLYASPGTLFFVDDTGVRVVSHTYQILRWNRRFLGFMYPIEDEMISKHFKAIERSIYLLIEPWRQQGYRGYGNIDWMVTKDGDSFIAERNARQTGVIPPLKIASELSRPHASRPLIVPPTLSILTRDRVYLGRPVTFEEIYIDLKKKKLLWGQSKSDEGIIITIPPLPSFGINSVGIMAIGSDLSTAYEIFNRSLHELGSKKEELLFELKI